MNCRAAVAGLLLALVVARIASAEVVRIDIQKRIDEGRYERLIGRVYFAVDPLLPANRAIADLAARSAEWRRDWSSSRARCSSSGPRTRAARMARSSSKS